MKKSKYMLRHTEDRMRKDFLCLLSVPEERREQEKWHSNRSCPRVLQNHELSDSKSWADLEQDLKTALYLINSKNSEHKRPRILKTLSHHCTNSGKKNKQTNRQTTKEHWMTKDENGKGNETFMQTQSTCPQPKYSLTAKPGEVALEWETWQTPPESSEWH